MSHVGLFEIESLKEIAKRFISHHTTFSFKQAVQSPKHRGCRVLAYANTRTRINLGGPGSILWN